MKTLLESKRLYFRNFVPDDCEEMFMLNADWDVLKYTGDEIFNTIKEAREFFEDYQTNIYEKYGFGRMTTILKETNEVIGWCGVKYEADFEEVDLGYRFHKRFWNKGYGTEASIACLKYAHKNLNLNYITAYALTENIASWRVMEKAGLSYVEMVEREGKMWKKYEIELPFDYDSFLNK